MSWKLYILIAEKQNKRYKKKDITDFIDDLMNLVNADNRFVTAYNKWVTEGSEYELNYINRGNITSYQSYTWKKYYPDWAREFGALIGGIYYVKDDEHGTPYEMLSVEAETEEAWILFLLTDYWSLKKIDWEFIE